MSRCKIWQIYLTFLVCTFAAFSNCAWGCQTDTYIEYLKIYPTKAKFVSVGIIRKSPLDKKKFFEIQKSWQQLENKKIKIFDNGFSLGCGNPIVKLNKIYLLITSEDLELKTAELHEGNAVFIPLESADSEMEALSELESIFPNPAWSYCMTSDQCVKLQNTCVSISANKKFEVKALNFLKKSKRKCEDDFKKTNSKCVNNFCE